MSTVTVCVPAFRAERFIQRTLASILAQTHTDLIVDIAIGQKHPTTENARLSLKWPRPARPSLATSACVCLRTRGLGWKTSALVACGVAVLRHRAPRRPSAPHVRGHAADHAHVPSACRRRLWRHVRVRCADIPEVGRSLSPVLRLVPQDRSPIPPDGALEVRRRTVEALSALVPALHNVELNGSSATLRGGWIFAWGEGEISNPASGLHERYDVGFFSDRGYHSINTGKYGMAPLNAVRLCDAISRPRAISSRCM